MNEQAGASVVFEQLIDNLDDILESMQSHAHARIDQGAFEAVQEVLKQAQAVKKLRSDLEAMAERYVETLSMVDGITSSTRLPKALKTPQQAYRLPILKALVAFGGEAGINEVLGRAFAEMKDDLNSYDLADLPQSETPRWRNTAQWARNQLREEGLVRDDTPRRVWPISEKGAQLA